MPMRPSATLMALCSELAYPLPGEGSSQWQVRVRQELACLQCIPATFVDYRDVQAFVTEYYGNRITVFRGTDSNSEWATNVFARRVGSIVSNSAKVHAGFYNDMMVFRDKLRGVNYYDGKTDWITGHSRGGATAAVMAATLHSEKKTEDQPNPDIRLVTHAAPKAGNYAFAQYLNENVKQVRWQRAGDVVPMLPLWPLFWHGNYPEYFDSVGIFRPGATLITRISGHIAVLAREATKPGLASSQLHDMMTLREMITQEEMVRGSNLLLDLMA